MRSSPRALAFALFASALAAPSFAASGCSASYTADPGDAGAASPLGCVRKTCEDDVCGTVADGCGGAIDCGRCGGQNLCIDNRCACAPRTCKSAGATCGQLTDGCTGNILFCGACGSEDAGTDAGSIDGGDAGSAVYCGPENRCVPVPCTPRTRETICAVVKDLPKPCGMRADGCGGVVDCGTAACTGTGQTCGGGGTEGVCGCKPKTSAVVCAGGVCGNRPNGCGGAVYCGSCR